MIVWRVQHPSSKRGPYRHSDNFDEPPAIRKMINEHNRDFKGHPMPVEEGFKLYKIDAKCVHEGEHQVMYHSGAAKVVEVFNITSMEAV